jgi:ribosomal protein S18 acetylase RimI-like enzyme
LADYPDLNRKFWGFDAPRAPVPDHSSSVVHLAFNPSARGRSPGSRWLKILLAHIEDPKAFAE